MTRLYLFKSALCEACRLADDVLREWERDNLAKTSGKLVVIRTNPNLSDFSPGGFSPRKTPSYALVDDTGELLESIDGEVLDAKGLDKLAAQALEVSA